MDTLDSFPFLAIPFFLLAGSLMETGGISGRLVRLANVLVGRFRGGLAQVTIVSTILFSDISGSSSADTAAIGSVTIPAMRRAGYPLDFVTALVAAAGATGVLIPPCITMVIYGFITNTSIAALFIAGFLPGILMAVSIIVVTYIAARSRRLPAEAPPTRAEVIAAVRGALLPMGMPVVILGGILGGLFTVTEAAVVAVVYGLIVALTTRAMRIRQLPRLMIETAVLTGMVMTVACLASLFQWILSTEGIPSTIGNWIKAASSSPVVFLLLVNVLFLILGCFLDSAASLLLAMPVLFPIAQQYGIDPVHFGIVATANLGIGMITPPVGMCLFIACSISGVSIDRTFKPLFPYIAALIVALLIMTYWPGLVLLAPKTFLGYVPK
jgi:C4-dicarboxylate transporter DctM subunit